MNVILIVLCACKSIYIPVNIVTAFPRIVQAMYNTCKPAVRSALFFFLFLVLLLLYVHGVRYKTGKVCYVLAVCIVRRVALHKHVLLGIVKLKQVVYMILFFPGQHCANIRRHPYRVIPHSIVCHTRDVYLSRSEYCSAPTPNQNNKHCSTSTRVDSVILNSISSAIVTPILKA